MVTACKLTIVTVCYNDLEALKCTIDALRIQNRKDFEQIVIDGASTDGTSAYLEAVAATSPGYLFSYISESDRGLYDAMNKGIRLARGKWCWFLNAGDIPHGPDTIGMMVEELEHDQENTPMHFFQAECVAPEFSFIKGRPCTARDFIMNMPICHQGVLYRVNHLRANHYRYDLMYPIVADHELTLRILRQAADHAPIPFSRMVIVKFNLEGLSSRNLFQLTGEQMTVARLHFPERKLEVLLRILESWAICGTSLLLRWLGLYGLFRKGFTKIFPGVSTR